MEGGNGLSAGSVGPCCWRECCCAPQYCYLTNQRLAGGSAERVLFSGYIGGSNQNTVVATHRVPILELVDVVVLKEGQLVMDAPKRRRNADRMQVTVGVEK